MQIADERLVAAWSFLGRLRLAVISLRRFRLDCADQIEEIYGMVSRSS